LLRRLRPDSRLRHAETASRWRALAGTSPVTAAAPATLKARWTYQDGQVVDESTQRIAPAGNARTEFHISKPDGWPPGKYKLEVLLNGSSAGTRDIEVER
jgi:hypothetical protein